MVDRTSQEVKFNTGNTVQTVGSNVGAKRADPNKFLESQDLAGPQNTSDAGTRILQNILGWGGKLLDTAVEVSREEAYLKGAAAAGTAQTEEDLQASVFTRDWAKAGYRDTMGRMKAADLEAEYLSEMKVQREKSPEEYAKYVASKRSQLMPQLEGMSRQGRQTLFAQTMLSERAAIKRQGVEHAKFVIDTEDRTVQASMVSGIAAMNAAKGDIDAYGASTDAMYGRILNSIVLNPKLPIEIKQARLEDAAKAALASDHQLLFKKLQSDVVTLGEGGEQRTLMSMVPLDKQGELSAAFRSSEGRTAAVRVMKYQDDSAKMQADWKNPTTPLQPYSEVREFFAGALTRGDITPEKFGSVMEEYYSSAAKKASSVGLAQAYASGDAQGLLTRNKTTEEGLEAWMTAVGSKQPLAKTTDDLLNIGVQTGQMNAFKMAGKVLQPGLAQLGMRKEIDAASAAGITGVFKKLDQVEAQYQEGAKQAFLSAFPEEMQEKVMDIRRGLAQGLDDVSAIGYAQDRAIKAESLPPEMRRAMSAENAKADAKAVAELAPRGLWGTLSGPVKAFFSGDASARQTIGTGARWFENKERVAEVMASGKLEVATELGEITRSNPMMPAEDRMSLALSRVAARTIETESGPFSVPRGTSVQQFFGVPASVGPERIGKAIDEWMKPEMREGYRAAFSAGTNGEVRYKVYNKDGGITSSNSFDRTVFAKVVEKQRQEEAQRYGALNGAGVTRVDPQSKTPVNYSGVNSANVDPEWMLGFRDNLVKHEGVRDTPYPDLAKPELSVVGVGVASHNPHYPKLKPGEKASPEVISASFQGASNDAAQASTRTMQVTRTSGKEFFQLFGEFAYQSGGAFGQLPAYKPLLTAIMQKDREGALKALEGTPAYKWTADGSDRRNFYRNTLIKAMNQNG